MKLSDFDYHLPESQIACYPAAQRDHSRLLVYDRTADRIQHGLFRDLPEYLSAADFLVMNSTRVLRARLAGRKAASGGKFELLLLREKKTGVWESLVKPGRGMQTGSELFFNGFEISARIVEVHADGSRTLSFAPPEKVFELMERQGILPLPPYIRRAPEAADYERYQTIYNRVPGSVAAPTAGLHFSGEVLDRLRERGIETAELTLNIGWGTFAPIREDDPRRHKVESEHYGIDPRSASLISVLKESGKKLVAVGTTSVRALESWYRQTSGHLQPLAAETELFIYPPYQFKLVDKMLTNFHLPKSTLLMLVAAFAGQQQILRVYREAVASGYRFFSYGDCMLIL